jgi:hypothetical protein
MKNLSCRGTSLPKAWSLAKNLDEAAYRDSTVGPVAAPCTYRQRSPDARRYVASFFTDIIAQANGG